MVYEIPASRASIKQNQFEFQIPGEKKTRSLPFLQFTPVGLRDKLARLAAPIQAAKEAGKDPATSDLQRFGEFQLEMLERYSPGVADVMDNEQLADLLVHWQEASRVSVGESRALPGS
jgi:hypothetical protein